MTANQFGCILRSSLQYSKHIIGFRKTIIIKLVFLGGEGYIAGIPLSNQVVVGAQTMIYCHLVSPLFLTSGTMHVL